MGKNRQKAYHIDNYLNVNGLNISIEREGSVDKKQKQNKNNKKTWPSYILSTGNSF